MVIMDIKENVHDDVEEILFSKEQIEKKVTELGETISADYKDKDLLIVGVLKGSNVFMSDLIRKINLPIEIDFIVASSYGKSTKSSGVVKILKDLDYSVEGRDVLIVEDIIDTGLTLNYLMTNFESRGVNSVKICTLLDKPKRRKTELKIDYCGFEIPDVFIVGYGIDYAERYRNLPYLANLKSHIYE